MKLINPWGLFALAVLAVVVIAYLLRMPRRQLPIPDVSIWRKLSAADQKLPTSRRTMISLLLQIFSRSFSLARTRAPIFPRRTPGRATKS